jgi:hypothetical protein
MGKKKKFDCIEMKRRGSLKIHERLAKMTFEEKVEYWRKRAEEFRRSAPPAKRESRDRAAAPS